MKQRRLGKTQFAYRGMTLSQAEKVCKRVVKPRSLKPPKRLRVAKYPKRLHDLDPRTDIQKLSDKWQKAISLTPPNGKPVVFCDAGRFRVRFYDSSGNRCTQNSALVRTLNLGRIRDCDLLAAYEITRRVEIPQ